MEYIVVGWVLRDAPAYALFVQYSSTAMLAHKYTIAEISILQAICI